MDFRSASALLGITIPYGLPGMGIGALVKRQRWETIQGWSMHGATPGLVLDVQAAPHGTVYTLGGRIRF